MCTACKCLTCQDSHQLVDATAGHRCKGDDSDQELLHYASQTGWKQCPISRLLIELLDLTIIRLVFAFIKFCFVCLIPWQGIHQCREYGQRESKRHGYHEKLFNKGTGLENEDYNRGGCNEDSSARDGSRKNNGKFDNRFQALMNDLTMHFIFCSHNPRGGR